MQRRSYRIRPWCGRSGLAVVEVYCVNVADTIMIDKCYSAVRFVTCNVVVVEPDKSLVCVSAVAIALKVVER